jgi:hypothetical protein
MSVIVTARTAAGIVTAAVAAAWLVETTPKATIDRIAAKPAKPTKSSTPAVKRLVVADWGKIIKPSVTRGIAARRVNHARAIA